MKLLLSVPSFYPDASGGGQVYVLQVARELSRRGHAVTVLTQAPWIPGNGDHVVETYVYDGLRVVSFRVNPASCRLSAAHTKESEVLTGLVGRLVDDVAPDLAHLNGLKRTLMQVCSGKHVPFVVTSHHPGFVCPAGTLLTAKNELCTLPAGEACVACCLRKKMRSRTAATLLDLLPRRLSRAFGSRVGRAFAAPYVARGLAYPHFVMTAVQSIRAVLDGAPAIIAPSRAIARTLEVNGVSPERIRVVPHGIEAPGVQEREPLHGRAVRFGFMGGCSEPKGFGILAAAVRTGNLGQGCEVHVYGGARRPEDEAYISGVLAGTRPGSFVFHPLLPPERLAEAYRHMDVLLVPSIYLEVFGLVVLEAQSSGCPVIASRCGGPEELIRDRVDGFLVARNDARELAAAMRRFVADPGLVEAMRPAAGHVRTIGEHVEDLLVEYERARAGQIR